MALPGRVLPAVVVEQRGLVPMVECSNPIRCFVVTLQDLRVRQRRRWLLPDCPVMELLGVGS